jgi:hypothetical protein
MEDKITIKDNIKNYYDEKSEAVIMNINSRKLCFKHNFINASLRWESKHDEKDSYCSINLESEARENFNPEWGRGYGGIRYCKNCKLIDCIHVFNNTITYKIETDEFSGAEYCISKCSICDRRILRSGCGYSNPSSEAFKLISDVFKEYNRPSPLSRETMMNYGSGYCFELPIHVSRLIRDQGEAAAKNYVTNVIGCGRIYNFNEIRR